MLPANDAVAQPTIVEPSSSVDGGFAPGAYEWRAGKLVRLDDRFRKTAVVVGTAIPGDPGNIAPWGSAFIAASDIGRSRTDYLVTAAHVVEPFRDAPFDVRFNTRDRGADIHHVDCPDWVFHPSDETVDVAVHEIRVPAWADFSFVAVNPPDWASTGHQMHRIAAGSRTYTVGLWKFLHGSKRNQTYVYSGHIGLIPENERIPVPGWLPSQRGKQVLVDAYLVEGEPLDGASGAPVFARRTEMLKIEEYQSQGRKRVYEVPVEREVTLIGMQTDAWYGVPGQDYEVLAGTRNIKVPRGINVVAPAKRISEVIHQPKLVEKRANERESSEKADLPEKTTVDDTQYTPEEIDARRDSAVRRALNTPKREKRDDGDA